MANRRRHVIGSLKHLEYVENRRGLRPVTIFPTNDTSPSPSRSPSKSPTKRNHTFPNHTEVDGQSEPSGHEYMEMPADIFRGHGSRSTNDYLRDWDRRRRIYIDEVLQREAPPEDLTCETCKSRVATWRCCCCLGTPALCTDCCRTTHRRHPFHRIECWTGDYFSPSWLWKAGTLLHLGHNGEPCPGNRWDASDAVSNDWPKDGKLAMDAEATPWSESYSGGELAHDEEEADYEEIADEDAGGLYNESEVPDPPVSTIDGHRVVTYVHINGVHQLPTSFCKCSGAPSEEIQLLRMGLFPSTSTTPQTAFSFQLLDDYLLENLECKTSALHYFSKLRRMTCKAFPNLVKDRYRELLRASRQWRVIKEYKWFGFGHKADDPKTGDLALFCVACPQPGVNLPDNWKDDREEWAYSRGFVLDGNFSCNHKAQRHPQDDVWLKSGQGFMVERSRYEKHLATAPDIKETPTCNEHHAVNDKSKIHKGCDSTGLGASACLRHGCYCPGGVVDFQKGERQMNIDYAFCEALKNTGASEASRCIVVYDVNCQYFKNFRKRVQQSPFLEVHPGLIIIPGIGLFHVHGHQLVCLARFSPTFIIGAGQSDGEILETLWSTLNHVGRISRTMTLAHRTEVLDAHMGDNNWKKLVNMVSSLCKKWKRIQKALPEAEAELKKLSETASDEQLKQWDSKEEEAQARRIFNPEAMDVYEAEAPKLPNQKDVQAELMSQEQGLRQNVGISLWVATGVKLQETQLALSRFSRLMGKKPTSDDKVELARRRQRFVKRLDAFEQETVVLFPEIDLLDVLHVPPLMDEYEHQEDLELLQSNLPQPDNMLPEYKEIILPSAFSNLSGTMQAARQVEIQLRVAQANDSLASIRLDIGHKSFVYRKKINIEESKKGKTRAYDQVNAIDRNLAHHLRVYGQARWALQRLIAPPNILSRFKEIKKADTHLLPNISRPNQPGFRNQDIPWFWGFNIHGDSKNDFHMEELFRVNYLRTKARYNRWLEESKLVPREMKWTMTFFGKRAEVWEKITDKCEGGKRCYASRQAAMWRGFETQALSECQLSGAI